MNNVGKWHLELFFFFSLSEWGYKRTKIQESQTYSRRKVQETQIKQTKCCYCQWKKMTFSSVLKCNAQLVYIPTGIWKSKEDTKTSKQFLVLWWRQLQTVDCCCTDQSSWRYNLTKKCFVLKGNCIIYCRQVFLSTLHMTGPFLWIEEYIWALVKHWFEVWTPGKGHLIIQNFCVNVMILENCQSLFY